MTVEVVIAGVAAPKSFVKKVNGVPTRFRFPRLKGVPNDLAILETFFTEVLADSGQASRVTVLKEPTVSKLLNTISAAAGRLSQGDTLVVALTGHGGQLPQRNDHQVDIEGLDPESTEVFIAKNMFVPSELLRAAWAKVDYGMTLVTIIDACSAEGIGFLLPVSPHQPRLVEIHDDSRPGRSHVAIAAARETEQALSLRRDNPRSAYYGLLTHALVESWKTAKPTSYRDWFVCAARATTVSNPRQTPVIRYVGPRPNRLDDLPFSSPQ